MNGDFSRVTFEPKNQYSRVLMQQGRVLLDADWNEQAAIFQHALRTFIRDLIGPRWGVIDGNMTMLRTGTDSAANTLISVSAPVQNSFLVRLNVQSNNQVPNDFSINPGHYYVNGILCENRQLISYMSQQGSPTPLAGGGHYLVYLDVWERAVSYLEDSNIREIALGDHAPDTAMRAKVAWQVRVPPAAILNQLKGDIDNIIRQPSDARVQIIENLTSKLTGLLQPQQRGALKARTNISTSIQSTSINSANAQYTGTENQLYRVEIHQSGPAGQATFKWSRENASVIFPVSKIDGKTVTLGNLGRDDSLTLTVGDWVEIVNDDYNTLIASDIGGNARPLLQVVSVDRVNRLVTLSNAPDANLAKDLTKHPLVRRWDQKAGSGTNGEAPPLAADGTILIQESKGAQDTTSWLALEDGIQIQFQPSASTANIYRSGDYWLIAARTASGDIIWPQDPVQPGPFALAPQGVEHHYALLAIVFLNANGLVTSIYDLRYMLPPLARSLSLVSQFSFPQK